MEDLAAKQRLRRPLGEDAARVASSDGGSAAVYGLDSTPAKGTQPAEGAQPRKATHPLATQAIAEHDMAGSVFYLAPVDNASGKIFGLKQKWMAVRRLTGKRQRGCAVTGERTTPYSQDEMAHQEKFKAVAAATRLRMKDPGKVMQDQAAFKEQTKYKTFYRFVFNLEWEAYEA